MWIAVILLAVFGALFIFGGFREAAIYPIGEDFPPGSQECAIGIALIVVAAGILCFHYFA